jgi:hypothetical protein
MKVFAFGTVVITTVILAAGCSSDPPTATQVLPIQGGAADTTHNFAVGVCAGNGPGQCQLFCSGALIAPNLVMTARHCVNQAPKTIDCTTATFGSQIAPTNAYYITTYYSMFSSAGWHGVKHIFTTPGSTICGNDISLLELNDNVPLSEAGAYVTPLVQYSMTDHTRYSTTDTAIGYGDTDAVTQDPGTRRIIQNVNIQCIPGDPVIDCMAAPTIFTNNDFITDNATCEGDSGSSAFEQKNFNKGIPLSMGVLSRGGASGSVCVEPIYTRTDGLRTFIVSTALTAASDGAYTPPAWTQPAPPADAGTPPPDAGSDGSTPPPPGTLGAPCADNTECNTGLCLSNDGGTTYICSQTCDPTGNGSDCALPNYVCSASTGADGGPTGYCFPAPPTSGDGGTTGGGGGCAVGRSDPSKPVPWGTLTLAGAYLAIALVRSRRRDR